MSAVREPAQPFWKAAFGGPGVVGAGGPASSGGSGSGGSGGSFTGGARGPSGPGGTGVVGTGGAGFVQGDAASFNGAYGVVSSGSLAPLRLIPAASGTGPSIQRESPSGRVLRGQHRGPVSLSRQRYARHLGHIGSMVFIRSGSISERGRKLAKPSVGRGFGLALVLNSLGAGREATAAPRVGEWLEPRPVGRDSAGSPALTQRPRGARNRWLELDCRSLNIRC